MALVTMGIVATVSAAAPPAPGGPPQWLAQFLVEDLGFGGRDLQALARGRVISRTLDTAERREVMAAGVVRINAPRARLSSRLRDIVNFKRSEMVQQIGRFSEPPRLDDVASLIVPDEDLDAIRQCRAGDCDVQLSGDAMAWLQSGVDFRRPDWKQVLTARVRQMLLHLVEDYRHRGLQALMTYGHHARPLSVADETRAVLGGRPSLLDHAQAPKRYLLAFPADAADAESYLYWSKERFGFKPVISVTHVAIAEPSTGPLVMVSLQLYATHYFDASVGVTALVEAEGASTPAFYMIYTNRTRNGRLGGAFGGIVRSIAERRVRSGMERLLTSLKQSVERSAGVGEQAIRVGGWAAEVPTGVPARRGR